MTPTRFPLQWPIDWPRTKNYARKSATFKRDGKPLTVFGGLERVLAELERLGVHTDDVVVSTNLQTRLDGMPRSGQARPADTGVCVYWQKPGQPMRCMAVDRYDEVQDNLAAIAATLEAMRAIERHGGAAILDRAFTGFAALPAPRPSGAARPWWEVLGVPQQATQAEIQAAHRQLASKLHPDRPGGSTQRMTEINLARDEGLRG